MLNNLAYWRFSVTFAGDLGKRMKSTRIVYCGRGWYATVCTLFVCLLMAACGQGDEGGGVSSCTVERKDYVEDIQCDGYAESVHTFVINSHGVWGKIKYIIEDGTEVQAGDTVVIIDSPEIEQELDNLYKLLDAVVAEKEKTEATYNLEKALQTAQMETNIASASMESLDSLQCTYAPPLQRRISELQLRRSHLEQERCRQTLEAMEVAQRIDVQRINTFINHIHRRIADQRRVMEGLVIRAPFEGLVLISNSWSTNAKFKIGDDVWDEMPLATLPDMSHMQVVMRMPENDYKRINIDDSVEFSFPSAAENRAWGRISKKIPVGIEATEGSKVRLFEVTAVVDSSLVHVMPQTGTHASIRLKVLRDTLVVPSVSIFDEDSVKVAFVRMPNGQIEQREVETAASSLTQTAVARGVRAGEELMLLHPATHRIKRKVFLNDNPQINNE